MLFWATSRRLLALLQSRRSRRLSDHVRFSARYARGRITPAFKLFKRPERPWFRLVTGRSQGDVVMTTTRGCRDDLILTTPAGGRGDLFMMTPWGCRGDLVRTTSTSRPIFRCSPKHCEHVPACSKDVAHDENTGMTNMKRSYQWWGTPPNLPTLRKICPDKSSSYVRRQTTTPKRVCRDFTTAALCVKNVSESAPAHMAC